MEITEVRIKLMEDGSDRLKAFCSITFDNCFVVRDLKIIEGASGPFVAMPSRKLTAHCPQCGCKNHLRAAYCSQCGLRLKDDRAIKDEDGRAKLYADIAHPINSECREMIQASVIAAYDKELDLAEEPGYVSRYDDYDFEPAESPVRASSEPPGSQAISETSKRRDRPEPKGASAGPHKTPKSKSPAVEPQTPEGFGEGIF